MAYLIWIKNNLLLVLLGLVWVLFLLLRIKDRKLEEAIYNLKSSNKKLDLRKKQNEKAEEILKEEEERIDESIKKNSSGSKSNRFNRL